MTDHTEAFLGSRYRAMSIASYPLSPHQKKIVNRVLEVDSPADWELTSCLCGCNNGRVLTEVDRYGFPYFKVVCSSCGLLYASPRWTSSCYENFYQQDYRDIYSPLTPGEDSEDTLRRLAAGRSAKLIAKFVEDSWKKYGVTGKKNPLIIEIGAGGGWNLALLPKTWVRIGYDADIRFLELAQKLFGIQMQVGFLDESLSSLGNADIVLLSHVVEHMTDPVLALKKIAAAVKPETIICIEVPGIYQLHKTGFNPMKYWQNVHTYTFCARTAADTCRRAGLEPLYVDEKIRIVLRPGTNADKVIQNDYFVGISQERYLKYCEKVYVICLSLRKIPFIGSILGGVFAKFGDILVRLAEKLRLIYGIRAEKSSRNKL